MVYTLGELSNHSCKFLHCEIRNGLWLREIGGEAEPVQMR